MMFAGSTEKLACDVVSRTYGMLEHCPRLVDQLLPAARRRRNCIKLTFCRVNVAWSKSVSTLADKDVRFGHAGEIDKWVQSSTSSEADPLKLFDDRFKEFPTFKRIKESTPAVKHTSRVEHGRLSSCNASLWVPCPKCSRYQKLRMGDGTQPGGIVWSKGQSTRSEKTLAGKTARYVCEHCQAELTDDTRGQMMRLGVWVPEGCSVEDDKARDAAEKWLEREQPWQGWEDSQWLIGEPHRDGADYGSILSSLYALRVTWGQIAEEFVGSQKNPQNLRNFVNQWLAETWEIVSRKATWEQIGERCIRQTERRSVCPKWSSLLTVGIDFQSTKNTYPWAVKAWGPDRRNATIAYGEADSLDELEQLLSQEWKHADGGAALKIRCGLIDSGSRPLGIYEFCDRIAKRGIQLFPSKGSSRALASDYDRAILGKNTAKPGTILYHVDTIRSQTWLDRAIHDAEPDGANGFTLHAGNLFEHADYLQQLLNDAPIEVLDSHNNAAESWERIDANIPNDYRDCERYGYVAMLITTRHGRIYPRDHVPQKVIQQPTSRFRELKIRR
jgi:phage terminase large subunit GpA-like protein